MKDEIFNRLVPPEGSNPLEVFFFTAAFLAVFIAMVCATGYIGELALMLFGISAAFYLRFIVGSAVLFLVGFVAGALIHIFKRK